MVVVDDPHNVQEALSEVTRTKALTWWDVRWSYFVGQFGSGVKVYSVV